MMDLINTEDLEVTELDIDRVLGEQTTHDLYCPNCNSCITRRVILRKRKRTIQLSDEESKRSKLGTAADSKLDSSAQATGNQSHPTDDIGVDGSPIPTADDHVHDREPDLFRCSSCFSFFISIGNGFKLFRIFGENDAKENVQDEQIPKFIAAFPAGSGLGPDERKGDVGIVPSPDLNYQSGRVSTNWTSESVEGRDEILPFSRQEPASGNGTIGAEGKSDNAITEKKDSTGEWFEVDTNNQLKESNFSIEVQSNHESGAPVTLPPNCIQVYFEYSAEDATCVSQQGGSELQISSNKESVTIKKSDNIQIQKIEAATFTCRSSIRSDEEKSDVALVQSSDLDYIRMPAFGKGTIGAEDKSDNPTTNNKDFTVGLLEVDIDNQLKKSNFTIDVQANHESGVSATVPPNNAKLLLENLQKMQPPCLDKVD
ncbi:Uncharacterized protein Adt_01308 [Abeliophyllum distichum]|uniref:Uncharacterized protein n=1 Tax=Abeliophyllum distichum TaxID=126358 RepID=A0ABD1VSH3_9LAMI